MTRYFTAPKAIAYDDGVYLNDYTARGQDVLVAERVYRDTGLLDEIGSPIYATDSIPCGFKRY